MGNKGNKNKKHSSEEADDDVHSDNQIYENITCPVCFREFKEFTSYKDFNKHLKECSSEFFSINKPCDIFSTREDNILNDLIYKYSDNYKIIENEKKYISFDTKVNELKKYINSHKISWQEGSCQLNLHRKNLLKESMDQFQFIDLFKELKISFDGEICYDAGGIYREWFTTIFETLEGEKLRLFVASDSDTFSYIINPFLKHNDENFKYFNFIGKLIGKALLDNITINVCFNKIIYKMILQEEISFDELSSIDSPFFTSMNNLKKSLNNSKGFEKEIYESLEIYYNIDMKDIYHRTHKLELINGGKEKPLENIEDYINQKILFMKGLYEPFVIKIREGIFKIIPKEQIQMFNSDELELILNGKPYIDLNDWKNFTIYKPPYSSNHKVIIWFWDILKSMTQKELSNFLMFCTGTSRVPFGGFSKLESNRGEIANFTIENGIYKPGKKNFIKAHTCFNRIDLPNYKKKEELKEALEYVSTTEILGFGID